MTDEEYQQKLSNCKNQQERDNLNDNFLKSKTQKNKINKLLNYIKNNLLAILALIVAIIGLFK